MALIMNRDVRLMRHCEDDRKPEFSPIINEDRPLTKRGIEQAVAVGEHFSSLFINKDSLGRTALILCADLQRTVQTAQVIAGFEPQNPVIASSNLTQFRKLGDKVMKQRIAEITKCFGDFRGYFELELWAKCQDYESTLGLPLVVVTQAPPMSLLTGRKPKRIPFGAVYPYPPPMVLL